MKPAALTTSQKLLLVLTFPATLLLFYFLFKKDEEEEIKDVPVRSSQLRVPCNLVQVVIGLQGVQIKAIQDKTGTQMSFQANSETTDDKVLVISGPAEGIRQAESIVRQLLEEHLPVVSETIYIPRSGIKIILGINRENIRNMSRISKAKIILNRTEARKRDKQFVEVELRGTSVSILSAKKLIMELMSKESDVQSSFNKEKSQSSNDNDCFVTTVEHPGHFWIQKIDHSHDPLEVLIKEMNDFYSSEILDENIYFAIGDMVASKLPYDGNWYRAEVKDVIGGDLKLYFVDFGDTEIVIKKDVRHLSARFLSLPFQAIECCLANIEPLGGQWSELANKEFEKLTNVGKWQPLKYRIHSLEGAFHKSLLCISLVDGNSAEGDDIAKKLVSEGFARYNVPVDNLSSDYQKV